MGIKLAERTVGRGSAVAVLLQTELVQNVLMDLMNSLAHHWMMGTALGGVANGIKCG